MREFFKGWKRKTGCVSLVLALVGLSEWISSYSFIDAIGFHWNHLTVVSLSSVRGRVVWIKDRGTLGYVLPADPLCGRRELTESDNRDPFAGGTTKWRWRFCDIELGQASRAVEKTMVAVPYWSIVLPLTLLSAWLLLGKFPS